jgi:hypothetical protein
MLIRWVSGHFAESHFTENVILGGVIHNAGQFFGESSFR